jgi:Zn-finger nucleic acid-binding protein
MFTKSIGEPCPKCHVPLIQRQRVGRQRSHPVDVAFCARCQGAWEIAPDAQKDPNLFPREEPAHG